jgi:hypothetical protein
MNLFFAVAIGAMAFGHVLAVSTKLALGTLRDGSLLGFYLIGVALAVPSFWLAIHAWRLPARAAADNRRTIALNAWLGATLLALGLHNLPLAAPALLDIAYLAHRRRAIGWVIAAAATLLQIGLLVASLGFAASGKSFEELRGMEPSGGYRDVGTTDAAETYVVAPSAR